MYAWQSFVEAILIALTVSAPLIAGSLVALFVQWARLRRAKLRAQRQELPPSTQPPEPPKS